MSKKRIPVEAGPNDHTVDLYDDEAIKEGYVRYGQWRDNNKSGRYLLPASLSGSDYSGSLVERSNHQKWQDLFKDGDNVWWASTTGGHGTYGIVIDIKSVPDDISDDVAEFLNALTEYPLADEELHSEMEMDAQGEAWENWAKSDFKRAVEKKFDADLDEVSDEVLFEVFREACDSSNTYWENQSGGDMYIDLDRVLKKVTTKELKRLLAGE